MGVFSATRWTAVPSFKEKTPPCHRSLESAFPSAKKAIRSILLLALSVLFATANQGCSPRDEPRKVHLEPPGAASQPATGAVSAPGPVAPSAGAKRLRVAIAAMVSPKETFVSYSNLVNYIGKKMGMEVELVQRKDYEEVNALLKKNLLDVAFVCTGAYVAGRDDFGMEILVAPVTQGRTVYYSYVIVPAGSPVRSFDELKGRTFAFTDPLSNTGRLAPAYKLAQMRQTPDRFFKSTCYTYSHDRSIESVAKNLVDGAAVDSLVWDYMDRKNPAMTSRTRIISKSEPYGIPPFVVSRAVGPELKRKLRDLFLHAHEDKEGKEILAGIMIDKFVVVDDSIYDSVRAMRRWVDKNAAK